MKKPNFKHLVLPILLIIFGIVICIQSLLLYLVTDDLKLQRQARTWDTKLIYACYNNKIQPCDGPTVEAWNRQNPDKAITESYLREPLD